MATQKRPFKPTGRLKTADREKGRYALSGTVQREVLKGAKSLRTSPTKFVRDAIFSYLYDLELYPKPKTDAEIIAHRQLRARAAQVLAASAIYYAQCKEARSRRTVSSSPHCSGRK